MTMWKFIKWPRRKPADTTQQLRTAIALLGNECAWWRKWEQKRATTEDYRRNGWEALQVARTGVDRNPVATEAIKGTP